VSSLPPAKLRGQLPRITKCEASGGIRPEPRRWTDHLNRSSRDQFSKVWRRGASLKSQQVERRRLTTG
jgi:hypothetical protein